MGVDPTGAEKFPLRRPEVFLNLTVRWVSASLPQVSPTGRDINPPTLKTPDVGTLAQKTVIRDQRRRS